MLAILDYLNKAKEQAIINLRNAFDPTYSNVGGKVYRGGPYEEPTPTATPTPSPTPSPAVQIAKQISDNAFSGFRGQKPSDSIAKYIQTAANKNKIDPSLLAALLYQESRFNPNVTGDTDPNDIGIAQINLQAHPDVKKEQAFDPEYAINWAAKYLANSLRQFDDINRTVASYNVGRGGANIRGPEPYGGGPLGQTYINNVARNLDKETIKRLGLKVSPSLLAEYQ